MIESLQSAGQRALPDRKATEADLCLGNWVLIQFAERFVVAVMPL
jgi:hypothetical protein